MFVMVKQIRKTKGIKTVSIELHVALPLQVTSDTSIYQSTTKLP